MACKIFIAPQLEVLFHFIERIASGRSRGIEHPCAIRASPALKTLFFYPYQFARHDLLCTLFDWRRLCFSSKIATTKTALFVALRMVLRKAPIFERTKAKVNTHGLNINDKER
jgi:hypothetical protein